MTNKNVKMTVVDADGEIITAANELVSSDNPELVKRVKFAALIHSDVQFVAPYGRAVEADLDRENPIGIAAALFAALPGRTRLLEAPAEVWDWIQEDVENGEPDSYSEDMSEEEVAAMMEDSSVLEESVRLLSLVQDDNKETDEKHV